MKTFKSITDVDRLRNYPLHDTVKSLVSLIIADCPEYRPEDDGWLVLIESGDTDRICACHYHRLREYMMDHAEVRAILGATD